MVLILVFWEKDRKCFKPICRDRSFNIYFLLWISQIMEVMAQKQHKRGNRSFVRCSFLALLLVCWLSDFPHYSTIIGVSAALKQVATVPWKLAWHELQALSGRTGLCSLPAEVGWQGPPPWWMFAHFQSSHAEAFMGSWAAHCWVPPNSTLSEPKAPVHSSIKFHCALLAQQSSSVWKLMTCGQWPWCSYSL